MDRMADKLYDAIVTVNMCYTWAP